LAARSGKSPAKGLAFVCPVLSGVLGKARNGEAAQNLGCRMTGQDLWCSIRIAGSGVRW
jgi:hypothetical protein